MPIVDTNIHKREFEKINHEDLKIKWSECYVPEYVYAYSPREHYSCIKGGKSGVLVSKGEIYIDPSQVNHHITVIR